MMRNTPSKYEKHIRYLAAVLFALLSVPSDFLLAKREKKRYRVIASRCGRGSMGEEGEEVADSVRPITENSVAVLGCRENLGRRSLRRRKVEWEEEAPLLFEIDANNQGRIWNRSVTIISISERKSIRGAYRKSEGSDEQTFFFFYPPPLMSDGKEKVMGKARVN